MRSKQGWVIFETARYHVMLTEDCNGGHLLTWGLKLGPARRANHGSAGSERFKLSGARPLQSFTEVKLKLKMITDEDNLY